MIKFELIYKSKKSGARVGRIHTPHGIINTPQFVAVGTNGTVKSLGNNLVDQLGLELMFCNTYHLLLHPGPEVIAQAGGLHKFINRSGPIITDSGGFQVFSLAYGTVKDELKSKGQKKADGSVLKITEEGVLLDHIVMVHRCYLLLSFLFRRKNHLAQILLFHLMSFLLII